MTNKYDISYGADLVHSYYFTVEFSINDDKVYKIGFSKISSIQNNVEFETIVEGSGEIHIVPKHISNPKVITFSKGVSSKKNFILKELYVGKYIKSILVTIGDINGMNDNYKNEASVFQYQQEYAPRQYILKNCVITKYSTSEIDALSSNVLWENFEITYTDKIYNQDDSINNNMDFSNLFD